MENPLHISLKIREILFSLGVVPPVRKRVKREHSVTVPITPPGRVVKSESIDQDIQATILLFSRIYYINPNRIGVK